MVSPPETDELDTNPIKLMTEQEIEDYFYSRSFDFNNCGVTNPEACDAALEFGCMTERLQEAVGDIHECTGYDLRDWDQHTDLVHDYFRQVNVLQHYFVCKNKAFIKLCEIFDKFPFDFISRRNLRTFHLCEGPGYFIEATYALFLRNRLSEDDTWHWYANTLNPYFENTGSPCKLVDDSHIRAYETNWVFGPSDDGDVKKLTPDYLTKRGFAGTFDLVTADGSTNTQGLEDQLENTVDPIISAEVQAALTLLKTGGRFIMKIYRLINSKTRQNLHLLADNFSSIKVFKPVASRPGSSEKYLICDGFGGKTEIDHEMMVDCDEVFMDKQLNRIKWHVTTYADKSLIKYSQEQRNQFFQQMRPKYFTAEDEEIRRCLHRMFPIGRTQRPSPWLEMYGNNLIRRFQEDDRETAVEQFLNTTKIVDPEKFNFDFDFIAHLITRQEKLFVTSDRKLELEDSMFIDAIAYDAVKRQQPKGMFYDIFEPISTQTTATEATWRDWFDNSSPHPVITVRSVRNEKMVTVRNILTALSEGYDRKMESFTIRLLTTKIPPMWFSRISASMFVLFFMLFEKYEFGEDYVRWSGKKYEKYDSSIRPLMNRFRTEVAEQSSIRSFIPLEVLEAFYSLIVNANVANMIQARRIYIEDNL